MIESIISYFRSRWRKMYRLPRRAKYHFKQQIMISKENRGHERADKIYSKLEPYAFILKVYAQMATGIVIAGLLITKFVLVFFKCPCESWCHELTTIKTLELVGNGLMYSAGFELAYMLFTPGPDEAIEPVILGMAAAILIVISDDTIDWKDAVIPLVLVALIGYMFYLSRVFLPKHDSDMRPKA